MLVGSIEFTLHELIQTPNGTRRIQLKNNKVKNKKKRDDGFGLIAIECLHKPQGKGMVACNFQIEAKMITNLANSDPGEEHFIIISKRSPDDEIRES